MKKWIPVLALAICACGWPRGEKRRLVDQCKATGTSMNCECRYAELEKTKPWKEYQQILDEGGLSLTLVDQTADLQCAGKKLEELIHGKPQ